jgi:hypothetical protein
MSKSEQLLQQGGRCGVGGEVCFNFPLGPGDFFIDVTSWIVFSFSVQEQTIHEVTRTFTNQKHFRLFEAQSPQAMRLDLLRSIHFGNCSVIR